MKLRTQYTCPLELVHDMIKGKWKSIILWQLSYGPTSLSSLEKDIEGISQKMLIEHLNDLVSFGFISKVKSTGYPLSVEYSLSNPQGLEIFEALKIVQKIGIRYMNEHNLGDDYFARIEKRKLQGKKVHIETTTIKEQDK